VTGLDAVPAAVIDLPPVNVLSEPGSFGEKGEKA
jgi:hypothetical protein